MNLMPFDEINTFTEMVRRYKEEPLALFEKEKLREDIEDYIEFLLIEAYTYGNVQAMYDLGLLDKDPNALIDADEMYAEINKPIAGKTFRTRVIEYLDDEESDIEDFVRVAETDSTRVYNAGVENGGRHSGISGVRKKWQTMEDERVRSTHEPLDGVSVPLDGDFYAWDGDHAHAPGLFSDPSNNCNCRCWITLIRE